MKTVFRDADELTAAPDLSAVVREALASSGCLIVVCTPRTPHSSWVGKEIALARVLLGDRAILTALFEGSPDTAFHPALIGLDADGSRLSPLAADFRKAGDGRRLALLKLVAALAGVPLDALIRRDAQRRVRRLAASAAATGVIAVIVAVSLALMLSARAQAREEQERGVATVAQLVSQREQLSRVGRLDLLAAQDRVALTFFRGRDVAALPADAQLLSARLLQAISEDDEAGGNLDGLREASAAAWRTTDRLLRDAPADTERMLSHAQSEYWVGLAAWRHGELPRARRHFLAYAALADRLATREPARAEWQREAGDAISNLATFSLRVGRLDQAGRLFHAAQAHFRAGAAIAPHDSAIQSDLADGYGWLADVERLQGRLPSAWRYRMAERGTLQAMQKRDPNDATIETSLIRSQLGLARVAALEQRWKVANGLFENGRRAAQQRVDRDPANADMARQLRAFELFEVSTWLSMPRSLRSPTAQIANLLKGCSPDQSQPGNDESIQFCSILESRLAAATTPARESRQASGGANPKTCKHALTERWNLDLCAERSLITERDLLTNAGD